ncbi:MAG: tRNA (adenosine(37)-N6)-threonylcarbamoyltransferase complex dimerization subunit type 1 TsaB [Proteobacteria bacterium]|nr:tRNA (adenosine(37)-N6)-threonylcarbamoyltransferase complex dimerization subunit type 1 TsaB [Pseudomonadota bacterium]
MLLREQRILGIEGSGFFISVGLVDKGVPRGLIFLNDGSPGSQTLLAAIDRLLSMLKIEKRTLDGICVTLGPGSFTSLRIGLSTAEAIGLGLEIPIYGVDSLILIAASVPFYSHTVKVVQNAYKGEFYTASYRTDRSEVVEQGKIGLIKPSDFYDNLQENDLILGNGVERLIENKFDLVQKKVRWNLDFQRTVSGIGVVEHFLDTEAKQPSQVPLEPIYIRLSEAEINYSKKYGDDGR